MTVDFRKLFESALHDEGEVLRPTFFADEYAKPAQLVTEDSYLRLRLRRMFLRHRRELFTTQYPLLHALIGFSGLDGPLEVHVVARPKLPGNGDTSQLDRVVVLDQTLLGPVLYRGGDLSLVLGVYAAPADNWAQRFLELAEGISQMALNSSLSAAISMAATVKQAVETTLGQEGLPLKLGLDQELKESEWLTPGYLVMMAAPDRTIEQEGLVVEEGELLTPQGQVYDGHDYLVLAIEVSHCRTDWQQLGYGRPWQRLLETASEAEDIKRVKDAFVAFSGAIAASQDLSWQDRSAIVALAKERVQQIRQMRIADELFEGRRKDDVLQQYLQTEAAALTQAGVAAPSRDALLATDWIG